MFSFLAALASRKAIKAIAGGIGGAAILSIEPAIKSFQGGFATGIGDSFGNLGMAVGALVGGFVVNYAIVWLSPKNKD